jgi:hypothetical protein
LIGIIVNRTETELWIKNSSAVIAVPLLRLKGAATTVQVPALDVYSREELYQQEAAKLDPTSASSELALASFSEQIFDFAHAIEHLQAASHLDPSRLPDITAGIERNTNKLKNQAQIDALRDIDHDRARAKFDDALKKCDAFLAKYEASPLKGDAAHKKVLIVKAREAYLRAKVIESWHMCLAGATRKSAADPNRTLEASLAWLDEGLGNEVRTTVTKMLSRDFSDVTPDLVAKYWNERKNQRWQRASYGQGTWLLGDAEARKGLEPEKKEAKPANETDQARAKLEDRIKRYLQNQENGQEGADQVEGRAERAGELLEGVLGLRAFAVAARVLLRALRRHAAARTDLHQLPRVQRHGRARSAQHRRLASGATGRDDADRRLPDLPSRRSVAARELPLMHFLTRSLALTALLAAGACAATFEPRPLDDQARRRAGGQAGAQRDATVSRTARRAARRRRVRPQRNRARRRPRPRARILAPASATDAAAKDGAKPAASKTDGAAVPGLRRRQGPRRARRAPRTRSARSAGTRSTCASS